MSNQTDKEITWNAAIVVNCLTMRRNTERRKSKSPSTSQQLTNYATNTDFEDYGGMFVMRHKANPMLVSDSIDTSNSEDVWFVDYGDSNHMTSHGEWFHDLWTPDQPGYLETGDDTTHPIRHVDNIPFGE